MLHNLSENMNPSMTKGTYVDEFIPVYIIDFPMKHGIPLGRSSDGRFLGGRFQMDVECIHVDVFLLYMLHDRATILTLT